MHAIHKILSLCTALALVSGLSAQDPDKFQGATAQIRKDLDAANAALKVLRDKVAAELPSESQKVAELEAELRAAREAWNAATADGDAINFEIAKRTKAIKKKEETTSYLAGLLSDYVNEFAVRVHISERQLYLKELRAAQDAAENRALSDKERFETQSVLLERSMDRLEESLGGRRFEGKAAVNGLKVDGSFALVGPSAIFRSESGAQGSVETTTGSLDPTVLSFANEEDQAATDDFFKGGGEFPVDPTLGNAHKVEATQEKTIIDEIAAGGVVMYPILGMAGAALLVALLKWLALMTVRRPSRGQMNGLLDAVEAGDSVLAVEKANAMPGPAGEMLQAGVSQIEQPRDLVEEVMYEKVLTSRLKLNSFLPFIAICAASAPLLGLLGTVTGIISTFQLITLFGAGDVATLSGGISEALITTKYGLIVAIPSLLLHAFLSRKAKGVIGEMETAAVTFVNQLGKSSIGRTSTAAATPPSAPSNGRVDEDEESKEGSEDVRAQVSAILNEMLGPLMKKPDEGRTGSQA